MEEDFAQWYTDVRKAELISYSSIRGCMIIRPMAMQYGKTFKRNGWSL